MTNRMGNRLYTPLARWLNTKVRPPVEGQSELHRAAPVLAPGDVILVEGRTRIAQWIKSVTHSRWTHSAIFIGRICDWEEGDIRSCLRQAWMGRDDDYLLLEAELGIGATLSPIDKYDDFNVRICRPQSLTRQDARRIVRHGLGRLGHQYDVRHLFDLARWMYPYCVMPRRWRSTLFETRQGAPARKRTICSTLIAEAFYSVDFPIQPVVRKDKQGNLRMDMPNARLCTPADFDTSPYFDILKFPWIPLSTPGIYHCFPWEQAEPEDPPGTAVNSRAWRPPGQLRRALAMAGIWIRTLRSMAGFSGPR